MFRRGSTRELTVTVGEFEPERPTRRAQAEPDAAPVVKQALGIDTFFEFLKGAKS